MSYACTTTGKVAFRISRRAKPTLRLVARLTSVLLVIILSACNGNDLPHYSHPGNAEIVGYTTVPLNVNKVVVRSGEAPVGDLVADAMQERLRSHGYLVDIALINGGNLRFNIADHADGIIPAGELRHADIDNLLPFGNKVVVMALTGEELKSTMERSVSQLPSDRPHGAFFQLSEEFHISADLSQPAQLLDETVEPPVLQSEGKRIVNMRLRGLPIQMDARYLVAVPDFHADGGDGYVTLRLVPPERRQNTDLVLLDLALDYVHLYQPVSPTVGNRIEFVTPAMN